MKIIKTARYNKKASKIFIGDCVTGLDDEYFRNRVADDATNLAQLVDNGREIREQEFFNIAEPSYMTIQKLDGNYKYYYNSVADVAWIYDVDKDIEYFYG